ncbi:MAG: hypothetical protein ACXADL_07825 [Candidatus Thorarchaeota archaeon]
MKLQILQTPWNAEVVQSASDRRFYHVLDVGGLSVKSTAAIQRRCGFKAPSIILAHADFAHS